MEIFHPNFLRDRLIFSPRPSLGSPGQGDRDIIPLLQDLCPKDNSWFVLPSSFLCRCLVLMILEMSGRVTKNKYPPRSTKEKVDQFNSLASAILARPIAMSPCSFCERNKFECKISPADSSRCSSCVLQKKSDCDVRGLSPSQLKKVADQYHNLEKELEEAEDRVSRLRKQKRWWYDKMSRAVSRGITDLDELDKIEREEQEERDREEAKQGEAEASSVSVVDPSFSWLDEDPNLDPAAVLADLDFGGGIPQASPSHSKGAR